MENEFKERLAVHYDELKWLYCELYSGCDDFFEDFLNRLEEAYEERNEELKKRDRLRETESDWYKHNDLSGMMLYVDAFAGNLKGVKEKLDYLVETGVNYLHLMPLLDTTDGKSDGGYAVSDFRRIKPTLGTMEDLEELTDVCHKRGINICMDFVMNHTSEDHEWARRARAGEKEYQDRYFFFEDYEIPSIYEQYCPQVFPISAPGNFTWLPEIGRHVMTTFYPYQWDLNYRNPVVLNEMTGNLLNLANKGVDIVRIDAVPYIWKELYTNCRNLKQVHSIVRILRMVTEVVCPGVLLLGEVVMEPDKVVPYFGTVEKPECHMLYNVTTMASTWHTVATRDVRLLKHQMDIISSLPGEYTFLNYLRCHDDIGWGLDYEWLKQFGIEEVAHKKYLNDFFTGKQWNFFGRGELYNDDPSLGDARLCGMTASLCGIEKFAYEKNEELLERSIRCALMLHAYMYTLSGIPILYSGDEIGQENDYSYHENPLKCQDSRYLHRGKFDWEKAKKRQDKTSTEGKIYSGIQRMIRLRSSCKAFESRADVWTMNTYNDHILAIGRYYQGEKLIAVFNFGDEPGTAWISENDGIYEELFTGEKREAGNVELPAYGYCWFCRGVG